MQYSIHPVLSFYNGIIFRYSLHDMGNAEKTNCYRNKATESKYTLHTFHLSDNLPLALICK